MADSETNQQADSEIDITQQVTSKNPVTRIKNQKSVATGKKIAEKSRQARKEQEKKLAEADSIIAEEQLRKAEEAVKAPPVEVPAAETPAAEPNLTTTQWLSVISIIISVVGIYYKREEIKKTFAKAKAVMAPTVDVKTPIKRSGNRSMD